MAKPTTIKAKQTMVPIAAEIGVLIYPDCQLSAVYGLSDLFRIAGDWSGGSGSIRVTHWRPAAEDVECTWDSHPGSPHRLSHLIVPPSIIMPEHLAPTPVATRWLQDLHAEGTILGSVCAGAFVLAETGLIDGRRATTHWAFAEQLARRFPAIEITEDQMVLDDGDIVTAGGILAWTDLGLTLVERLLGATTMLATARFLLIDPPRSSQRPFAPFNPRFDHGDDAVRRAQHYLHAHFGDALNQSNLHAVAGMTERTFLRRFTAATGHRPNAYLQQVRIAKAREALERTLTAVDQIAWQVGYSDPAAFRKIFQKIVGTTPAAYRQRFGIAAAVPA
ncbi:GlxA family transcriptional regulator [Fulvimarina manganoxydans]|uniref:GlxA family transcriptional regulator n=1 Tax=Fulvimarina manganoxydans TaxID=937218 RepID=UPI002355568D|nr:GlxA family transcriptional regulator [Fulvimarina manganoxydans]